MTYSTEHRYVTFGGSLPGGEIWQSGLRLAFPTGATYADGAQDDSLVTIAGFIEDWFGSGGSAISTRALLEWVKQAILLPTGLYKFGPGIHEYPTPVAGGSAGTAIHPNQVSMVVSLRTGTSFGDAQRGRFYAPMPAIAIQTNGHIASAEADAVAVAAAGLLDDLNTVFTGGAAEQVVVMSTKGTGTTRLVTSVAVGSVLDTQRSRRNGLDEEYQEEALA